jgi:hypothetical protein
MADNNQRPPYRSNEPFSRGAPSASAAPAGGSDPLAELARLIGQNDPFSEFGRAGAAAQRPAEPSPQWVPQPAAAPSSPPAPGFSNDYYNPANEAPPPAPQGYGTQNFDRQPFGGAPFAAGSDIYRTGQEEPAYADEPAHDGGYQHDPYYQNKMQMPADDEDIYDDAQPSRRRTAIIAVAAVFALAVVGTAGAFGYRVLFSSSRSNQPPPVIKADTEPSKVVPAASGSETQSNKLIYDRVGDRGQTENEKLVSREEQPVDVKDKPIGVVTFPNQGSAQAATIGNGVIGSEPKKVRTIAIHPDDLANAAPAVSTMTAPTPSAPAPKVAIANTKPAAIPRVSATAAPAAQPEPTPAPVTTPAPRQVAARSVPPAPVENAPMSLSPDAAPTSPARAAAPARTAAMPSPTRLVPAAQAPAASSGSGGYAVQVSSQRSEAEAQAAFRSLQGKYPTQLGNRQPEIHRADLGTKGIYFRAMVGPFASSSEAGELCSSLKAAGGSCIVQRN